MKIKQMGIGFVLFLFISAGLSWANGPVEAPAPAPEATKCSEEEQAAMAQALLLATKMGLDTSQYIMVPLDRNKPAGVLSDHDISPFILPLALSEDWRMVLFLPSARGDAATFCFYLDKQTSAMRGYVTLPPRGGKGPIAQVKGEDKPDYRSGAVKTPCGYLLVWNQADNYYTLEIKGNTVTQTSTENIFFSVDGKFLQIQTIPAKEFMPSDFDRQDGPKKVLEAYRDWEMKYQEEQLGGPLHVQSTWKKCGPGQVALLCSYDMPPRKTNADDKQVLCQYYLVTLKGQFILMLNGGTTAGVKESDVLAMLTDVLGTLVVREGPTDLNQWDQLACREAERPKAAGKSEKEK